MKKLCALFLAVAIAAFAAGSAAAVDFSHYIDISDRTIYGTLGTNTDEFDLDGVGKIFLDSYADLASVVGNRSVYSIISTYDSRLEGKSGNSFTLTFDPYSSSPSAPAGIDGSLVAYVVEFNLTSPTFRKVAESGPLQVDGNKVVVPLTSTFKVSPEYSTGKVPSYRLVLIKASSVEDGGDSHSSGGCAAGTGALALLAAIPLALRRKRQ